MTLRRIFSDSPLRTGTEAILRGDAASHVLRVLRLRPGDSVVLFDGSGFDYAGEITGVRREEVAVRTGAGTAVGSESSLAITLLQGICRGPRMDIVIQKATELGVTRVVPVLAGRSVVRLDDQQAARKVEHWRRVAIAAAEQSGRSHIPGIDVPRSMESAIAACGDAHVRLQLDPRGQSLGGTATLASPVALLVGPEGGLTEAERRVAQGAGFRPVRLGPRILRTETAPLAALAILQFLGGDMA